MRKIRSIEVKARDIPQDFLKKLGSHISQVGGLYVHTPAQLKKKSKIYLVKQVLRLEKLIVIITYNAYKMQLPRLRTIRQKALPARPKKRRRGLLGQSSDSRRTTKRKARFRKGSPEAKRYMAQLRRMRK